MKFFDLLRCTVEGEVEIFYTKITYVDLTHHFQGLVQFEMDETVTGNTEFERVFNFLKGLMTETFWNDKGCSCHYTCDAFLDKFSFIHAVFLFFSHSMIK